MKNVMTRAWEIAKEAVVKFGGSAVEYLSGALKQAWKEVKQVINIEKLEEMGAKYWEGGQYRRLYLNDLALELAGIEAEETRSGNYHYIKFNGETTHTKSMGKKMIWAVNKAYINLDTMELEGIKEDEWGVSAQLKEAIYSL